MTLIKNFWRLSSFCMTFFTIPYWTMMPSKEWIVIICLLVFVNMTFFQFHWISGISVALIIIIAKGNIIEYQHEHLTSNGQNIIINGKAGSFFKQNNFGFRGIFEVHQVNRHRFPVGLRPKVLLYSQSMIALDQTASFSAKIKPIVGLKNETGFDAESYYFSHSVLAKVFVVKELNRDIESHYSLRQWLYDCFTRQTSKLSNKALANAISFSDRTNLTQQQWTSLKSAGIAHLIAISGLHIGIAYLIGFGFGKLFVRAGNLTLWIPIIFGALMALGYAWLAGFSISTIRALIMVSVNIGILIFRVKISLTTRLLITLSFVLVIDSFAFLSSGFWLSFGAVAVVFTQKQWMPDIKNHWGRIILLNGLLSIAILPISGFFFGGVSLFSPIYNSLLIPLYTLAIIPLLFLLLGTSVLVPDMANWMWISWDRLLSIGPWLTRDADVGWIAVSGSLVLFTAAIVILLMVRRVLGPKIILWSICCVFSLLMVDTQRQDVWKVTVLDVGQGSSLLIERFGHYILYDTGKSWQGGSIAESVISPVLTYRGAKKLDGFIISHNDNDHSGGEKDILSEWQPDWLMTSRSTQEQRPCVQGNTFLWFGLTFDVVWPTTLVANPRNKDSCVIRVSDAYGNSVLLTGDISKIEEWTLVHSKRRVKSDVMIVPHHGSKTSSSRDFIELVEPELAIANLAYNNFWGFPSAETTKSYALENVKWMDTGMSGSIDITFYSDGYEIGTSRSMSVQPWYRQMLRKKVE